MSFSLVSYTFFTVEYGAEKQTDGKKRRFGLRLHYSFGKKHPYSVKTN